ncbi:MAG: hypothetical protein ACXV8A_00830 [Chthoniobacterales bacterium]
MKMFRKAKEHASALVITMLVIFLITVSIGIAVSVTTFTVRQTDSSRDFSALRSATEGALDFAYGVWAQTINTKYRPAKNSELAITTPPPFTGFSYSTALQVQGTDQYGRPFAAPSAASTPPPIRINLDNYPGWVGVNTAYVANAGMTGVFIGKRTVQYQAKRSFNYTVVPLFQATAFFENDLELYRPATMTVGGLVHTNSKAYVSSSSAGELTFSGHLSYSANNGYLDNVDPPQSNTWSGWAANAEIPPTYSAGGKDQQVDQVARIEPLGADATTLLSTTDTNRNNDSMRELIEPPDTYVDPLTQKITTAPSATDPSTISQRRLYNKAGIRIRITGTALVPIITVTTANGTSLSSAYKTQITSALSQATIYDRREGQNVDITSLDIGKARSAFDGASGFNNILYIDDTRSLGTDPKAIRLVNGSTLPTDGLTVASQNAVYIQGDYNTIDTLGAPVIDKTRVSSAVFADAVTILSNSWNDSNSSAGLSSRMASNTTVNTAIVAGFLPSGWTNPVTGATYGYSGGLNNFPRFLENWSGHTFNYTGSMIELFTSGIATGEWDTGSTYAPPIRNWNFDSNFVDNPPPGSLDAVSIGRGALVRY